MARHKTDEYAELLKDGTFDTQSFYIQRALEIYKEIAGNAASKNDDIYAVLAIAHFLRPE